MTDSTNQGIPAAGATTAGSMARLYAIKRLQRQQQTPTQQPGRVTPPASELPVRKGL